MLWCLVHATSHLSTADGAHAWLQGVTDGWRARTDWVTADGGVNIDALDAAYGKARVTAVDAPRFAILPDFVHELCHGFKALKDQNKKSVRTFCKVEPHFMHLV